MIKLGNNKQNEIQLKNKLRGIIPPMITPLKNFKQLDNVSLQKTINRMLDAGVHGLFVLGTTGEAPSLSHKLKKQLIVQSLEVVHQRVPVLVGITDSSVEELLRLAKMISKMPIKVDAFVLAPPFYAPISQSELLQWLKFTIPKIPGPVVLYNMPSHTKINIDIATVQKMAEYEKVIGIKDSSGNMSYFNMLLGAIDRPDFCFLTGPEILLGETIFVGGDGAVSGGANLYPRLFVALYEAATKGDMESVYKYQQINWEIHLKLYNLSSYGSSFLCSVKAAMSIKGVCQNVLAPPFFPFNKKQVDQVRQIIFQLEEKYEILRS